MKIIIEVPDTIQRVTPTKRDRIYLIHAIREALEKSAERFHEDSGQHRLLIQLAESNIGVEK